MKHRKIQKNLLSRLPNYISYIRSLPEESIYISATAIANALGLGEVLVRKDLATVSSGGKCRVGYNRAALLDEIEAFVDNSCLSAAVIVGTGKLGQALLDYDGFEQSGFQILAGFDEHPAKKRSAGGRPIYAMDKLSDYCRRFNIHIGIIATPASEAQSVCDTLVVNGIEAIWNFAPVDLEVAPEIILQNENLNTSITSLRSRLENEKAKNRLARKALRVSDEAIPT